MSNHGLRRIFSLLLAVMMVCTLLPTAVFAQEATEQPVVEEKQDVLPAEGEKKEEEAPNVEGDKQDGEVENKLDEDVSGDLKQDAPSTLSLDGGENVVAPLTLDTGHTLKVRFQVLYLDDTLYTGYRYGTTESTTFVCQYKTPHSDTGATNHTIAISDIKSAVGRADVESGYTISGWTKTASANPQVWPFTVKEPTACMSGQTIYLVAKKATPSAPATPTFDNINGTVIVHLTCSKNTGHNTDYPMNQSHITNGYCSVTAPKWSSSSGYTSTLTVYGEKYVEDKNSNGGVQHTLVGTKSQDITLTYNTTTKKWTASKSEIYFTIQCNEDQPKAPDAPTADDIVKLSPVVTVNCTNTGARHGGWDYPLEAATITNISAVTGDNGVYTCTVTVKSDVYVEKFVASKGMPHSPASESKTFTLTYKDGAWTKPSTPVVTFNVKCLEKPYNNVVEELLRAAVRVECTTTPAAVHPFSRYNLLDNSYVRGDVQYSSTDGYTCDITIEPDKYVEAYNKDVATGHTLSSGEGDKTVTLTYDETSEKWSVKAGTQLPIIIKVECETAPATPGPGVLNNLNLYVKFNCTEDGTHNNSCLVTRSGVTGGYEVTEPVKQSDGKYTSTLTVNPQPYFDHLYGSTTPAHTLQANDAQTVTLTYDPATEKWTASGRTVEFNIKCEPVVEPPEKPSEDQIKDLLEGAVVIQCINEDANHGDISFTLAEGEYVLGEAVEENEGVYTYTVTVKPAKYVKAYSELPDINKEHKLSPDTQGDKIIKLQYDALDGWYVVDGDAPVTYTVICENEPQKPDAPTNDEIKKATAAVKCTTGHGDLSWTLRDGTFTVGEVTGDDTTGYTCTVTVKAEVYVNAFNSNKKADGVKHTLADAAEKTFTMTYVNGAWTRPTNPAVTFEVKCETEPETTYTVTYTDGVDGEVVFADQVFKDLKSGEATPKFNGTPTRKNYVFAGWNPAVADKVTADVTYVATWKPDFNNNGKDDDTEDRYTVTYKDGASGKAFADQVYKDLLPGVDTPEFSGKPTRKGYTFAGWSPKVADTVTKTVTYTATWKAASTTGKDKVPKTGDSGMVLILGSVMLFSFCGATAVYVFDRKRKQG